MENAVTIEASDAKKQAAAERVGALDARTRSLALAALLVGAFLPPLDFFIVNLALPAIRSGLHASASQLQLIISAYASAYAVFLITGGRLGDLYGRKRMFMTGMGGFVLASALCGLAPSGGVLIAGRILQGITASVMAPQVLATIRTVFSDGELTRVMGLYGSVFGLSAIAGQLGGGALITLHPFGLGWQSIFWINVPIGAVALIGAAKFVPETQPAQRARIDVAGVALLSLFLASIIYPLTQGREAGWPLWTYLSFLASVPILAAFIAAENRIARSGGDPLIDLTLFQRSPFVTGLAMTFLFYSISAFFLTFGVYLQSGLGWSPLASGAAIMPFAGGFMAASLYSATLAKRVGANILQIGFGMLSLGFAGAMLALRGADAPGLAFYAALLCAGLGQGFVLPSVVRTVLASVDASQAGLASGVVTSTLQIGAAVGVAAIGGVFFTVLGHRTAPASYATAFQSTMAVLSVLQLVCLLLAAFAARKKNRPERESFRVS
ncbi:MFS transporter [Capsulimonas corticalis]|uniref:MFS transporter n=1 Tax=Capsulimonas corticalis TaxID=2219043 RepID=A0A402CSL6_9BACT|nr:MFS transporter [Capsulimonas corticalis]BDI31034.1 MFS transporter [Capsulimonas corticalis]